MWKKISGVLGALVLIGSFISGYIWFDTKYAKAADVQQNKTEIKITQLQNDVRWYQDQMSYIMSKSGTRDPNKLPQYAYKNYMDYANLKRQLEKQLNILMQQRSKY